MKEFKQHVKEYQKKYEENKERQLILWKELVLEIFGTVPSKEITIKDQKEIVKVLDSIGKSEAYNHTFMPSGGGLDLSGARHSNENELIELAFGDSYKIISPTSLTFYAVGNNPEWWYFRLNAGKFNPTKIYDHYFEGEEDTRQELFSWSDSFSTDKQVAWSMQYVGEEVLEVNPGVYEDRGYWESNNLGYDEEGKEIPLPRDARIVTRKFNGGAFVIFPKFSAYNQVSSTYDGRHNTMSSESFHKYINEIEKNMEDK